MRVSERQAAATGLERVEPQLRDLSSLAAAAAALPTWSRAMRARHSGQYLSRVRGRGMEYDESRPYQPGDDIRQLDWRVTARTGKPHTKMFREERERPVFLGVDYGRDMFFGTRGVFKAVQAARLASLLAWRAQYNGDRVGGLVFAGAEHHELPPRRGQTAVMRWLKLLADEAPACRRAAAGDGADNPLSDAVARLRRIAKPGSLIFLISDFASYNEALASELAQLAAHTDLALLHVYDPLEARFPEQINSGTLRDSKATLRLSDVGTNRRERYAAAFTARTDAIRQLAGEQRLLFQSVSTDADAVGALVRLLRT